ncbi:MAG: hypothetical protein FWH12_00120 [Treponema sp.]|nr:hypothetical protein [Treponema sp.]
MKIELFTFCDFAQENSGKLTIVGTFDTIISRNFPCMHPHLSVVIRLRFDLWEFSSHQFRIEARDLEGEMAIKPVRGNLEIKATGNATAVSHLVFTVSNLHFKQPGVINFVLYIDDKEIGSIPLYLSTGLFPGPHHKTVPDPSDGAVL